MSRPGDDFYAGRVKYDATKAAVYRSGAGRRRAAENALISRVLADVGVRGRVLDAPCGTGRLAELPELSAARLTAGDYSPAMLTEARGRLGRRVRLLRLDAEGLPFADRAFDVSLSIRFLHHLPRRKLERVLDELTRVTGRCLIVSFFHPVSMHGLQRALSRRILGTRPDRYAITLRELSGLLAARGFRLRREYPQRRWLKELWVAAFERRDGAAPA